MAFKKGATPPPERRKTAAMASSRVDLEAPSWRTYRLRSEQWQEEAWRFYDIVGELHAAANWMGSACSRVRIYVADVDKYGRIGEEVKSPEIQAIADTLFGGPAAKAEAMRSLGINLTVAGECYIVGRSVRSKNDEWYILSPGEIRRSGPNLVINLGYGQREEISPGRDLAIRVWTPHPRLMWCSDSPARGALLILREIEQLTRYTFSQIDSRLAGAGVFVIPPNMDFPDSDPDEDIGPVETFVSILGEAMSASMAQDGTAKSVVPIIVERPPGEGENNKFEHITFESALSQFTREYRDEAIRRLALAMDMPPEILLGTGDTNHWSAWHIEESTVKIHVEPMLNRICDALTQAYLTPMLKLMGEDPAKFTFWFDTAPLTVRPNRLQDTLNLYTAGIASRREVLEAGAYNPETAAPDQEEDNVRFMRELVLRDPTLFAVPEVREILGFDMEFATPEVAAPGGPPPPPAPGEVPQPTQPDALPERPSDTTPSPDSGLVAAAVEMVPGPSTMLVACDLMVHRALELAGKRLHKSRERDQWLNYPPHELHTKFKVRDREHAERLLMGAWTHLGAVVGDLGVEEDPLRRLLHAYCVELLIRSMTHDRSWLSMALKQGGLMS